MGMPKPVQELELIAAELRPWFAAEDEAREKALRSSRQVIRHSGDAIRAVHRQDHGRARKYLDSARELLGELDRDLAGHGRLLHMLMTMDFPELLAHGLRRTTDSIRGIVERTRGDITISLRQENLEKKLDKLK